MKRFLQIAALALLVTLGGSWRNAVSAQPGDDYDENYGDGGDVSYQQFYDDLSPYGRWVDYPEYGYVWTPNGIDGFQPYETGGHWVWTDDYEWMWVSDYSWGWATFHYGRWFHDPYYGWMWMPGYEWAPAWVAWRDGGDYYGWAPLRPGFNIGINISIGGYNPPADYWCFAPRRYISSPRIYDYCLDRGRNVTIINNTTIINNYGRRNNVFYNGPRRADAERYTGRINPVRFRESSRPGRSQFRNNEVSIYRPRVKRDDNRQFTPRNFDRYDRNGNNNGAGRNRGNNNGTAQGNNNNRPERRNVFDRGNNNGTAQGSGNNNRPERRNVFDRRNNGAPAPPAQGNNDRNNRQERRNIFDRGNNNGNQPQPGNDDRRTRRPEQRNTEARPQQNDNNNRQPERRNVFDRGRNSTPSQQPSQPERRNVFERRSSPQVDRPQQQQPQRQFERRSGGDNQQQRGSNQQRGGNNDNRGGGRGRRG